MRRVILESPWAAANTTEELRNRDYVRACIRDCLMRGDAPMASHGLYGQQGVLLDTIPEERSLGMRAGFSWHHVAEASVVYTDFGISDGMRAGIESMEALGKPVEYRTLR